MDETDAFRAATRLSTDDKRVLAATIIGTSIEWYDYLIYAQSAALIFGPLFFAPAMRSDPDLAQIFSLATIGIALLFRPLGAMLCGYLGDRFGRRVMPLSVLHRAHSRRLDDPAARRGVARLQGAAESAGRIEGTAARGIQVEFSADLAVRTDLRGQQRGRLSVSGLHDQLRPIGAASAGEPVDGVFHRRLRAVAGLDLCLRLDRRPHRSGPYAALGYLLLALWAVPMWWLIDGGTVIHFLIALLVLAVPLGLSYGPQAAVLADLFPARVRYSGISMGYALGSILGGAFAPTIAQGIMARYHGWFGIGIYIAVLALISLTAVTVSKSRRGQLGGPVQ